MLLDALLSFASALRDAGVPVGPSEVIDASSALAGIDISSRPVFRAALSATMIKNASAYPIFDTLFEVFFASGTRSAAEIDEADLAGEILKALLENDQERLAELAGEAVDRFSGIAPDRPVSGVYYAYRTGRALDLDRLRRELLAGMGEHQGEADSIFDDSERQAASRIAAFRAEIDRQVMNRIVQDRGAEEVARTLDLHMVEDAEIMHASADELRELRRAVTPLAVKLAAKLERRHRSKREGRLDFRATIRHSLSTGGVPLYPITRKDRPMRPEVILMTDVSGSVASFARFTLQLLYALSSELRKLRSFAFIDEIDEVTELLTGGVDIQAAVSRIASSAKVVGLVGHSDYGNTFRLFLERYGYSLSSSTTLIICGDGRSNYHDPQREAFRGIAERVKKVYWLNPEPRSYWNTGDSTISSYEPFLEAVEECRSLRQLQRFVEEVL